MIDDTIKENWNAYLRKIRKSWNRRSANQLIMVNKRHERYKGILRKRYGYSEEKATSELSNNYAKVKLD